MKEIEELKNTLDNLVDSSSDLNVLIEFEEVLDNLDRYLEQGGHCYELRRGCQG